jgi:hypothetical protein
MNQRLIKAISDYFLEIQFRINFTFSISYHLLWLLISKSSYYYKYVSYSLQLTCMWIRAHKLLCKLKRQVNQVQPPLKQVPLLLLLTKQLILMLQQLKMLMKKNLLVLLQKSISPKKLWNLVTMNILRNKIILTLVVKN